MRSSVSEVAFFILPTVPDEATKKMFESASVDSLAEVEIVGKATGSAIGWGLSSLPTTLSRYSNKKTPI
jgi:hypothetical protein